MNLTSNTKTLFETEKSKQVTFDKHHDFVNNRLAVKDVGLYISKWRSKRFRATPNMHESSILVSKTLINNLYTILLNDN